MVKAIGVFLLLFSSWFQALAAPACSDLLNRAFNLPPETPNQIVRSFPLTERIQINQMSHSEKPTIIRLEAKPFHHDYKVSTMDLLQMMVHTTSFALNDKNVIFKDELVLGFPLKDGYSLQATYAADGRVKPGFTLQNLELISPTGEPQKIAKGLIERDKYVITKQTIELGTDVYPSGQEIKAALPVQVEGETLSQIKKMTPDLELFDKSELKKIAEEKTFPQMRRSFLARKTKSLFNKYFVAAPFKTIANFLPTILLASAISWSVSNLSREAEPVKPIPAPAWVQTSINQAAAKSISPEVKILFNELKEEAQAQIRSGAAENPAFGPASLSAEKYKFSDQHMTWVFEQADSQGHKQTYIVLTEEIAGTANEPIKYLVLKVDPAKYKILIDYIKSQGHVLAKK